jgi:hypothetical protein
MFQELVLAALQVCLRTFREKKVKGSVELKLAVALQLLKEADLVYDILSYLLSTLPSIPPNLVQRFKDLHITLRSLYEQVHVPTPTGLSD